MGIATGCLGMSGDDFERCTPSEFSRIYDSWAEREIRLSRESWERVRTLVSFVLPLYRTKKSVGQLLPFPWDNEKENAAPKGGSCAKRAMEVAARITRK